MIPISQDEIHHFSDGTSLIQSPVNIVNWNGLGELPSMELVALGIMAVDELSVRATAERLSRDLAGDPKHIYKHKIQQGSAPSRGS